MRRWLLLSVLVLCTGIGAAALLRDRSVARPSRGAAMTVPKALGPTLRALQQRMLHPPSLKPRVVQVPAPTAPPVQGYTCPAAGGNPCGQLPCTVYATPGNGGSTAAVPLHSAPCAKPRAHQPALVG